MFDDLDDMMTPEAALVQYKHVLCGASRDAEHEAHGTAKWIARHDASMERALLEEVADRNPEQIPFLLGAPRLLAKARRNHVDITSGAASKRWAANRARKKLAKGRTLTAMELAAIAG